MGGKRENKLTFLYAFNNKIQLRSNLHKKKRENIGNNSVELHASQLIGQTSRKWEERGIICKCRTI